MKSKNKIMDSFEEFIALPLSILKNRIISFHLNNGVRIMDATTTTIYADVTIE